MQDYVSRLRLLVEKNEPRLLAFSDAATGARPGPGKWSPREVLGHLIDSASNNHQRFVRARSQDHLVFAGYDQEAWVELQNYANAPWKELVALWRSFNLHLARVMEATPEEIRLRPRAEHNLDQIAWRTVAAREPATLDYFMADYVGHFEHHLRQILGDVVDEGSAGPLCKAHASHPGSPRNQSLGLVSLVVRDYDEALAFFVGTLGFRLVEDTLVPEQSKRWVVVSPPGATESQLLLARASTKEQESHIGVQTGGRVFLFLYTDDFWRDYESYKARGVAFIREPKKEPYGTVAVFLDLYGNMWDLLQPTQYHLKLRRGSA